MGSSLLRLGTVGLDLLFPPRCFGCSKHERYLCSLCEGGLARLERPYCDKCGQPLPSGHLCEQCFAAPLAVDGIRAPFLMRGPIRDGIHSLKYRNLRAAAPTFGRLLAEWLSSHPIKGDVLVPVALHPRRLRYRGYNQSEMLAREVGKRTGLPVAESLLSRIKDARPQVSVAGRDERKRNVEGSFACVGDSRGLKIILVDDVATTGSTLAACAMALKSRGASTVWGLVLARD